MRTQVVAPQEAEAMKELWSFIQLHRDRVNAELLVVVEAIPEFAAILRKTPPQQMLEQQKLGDERQRRALVDGQWDELLDDLRKQATTYALGGIKFSSWMPLLTGFRDSLRTELVRLAAENVERASRLSSALNHYVDITIGVLGEAYVDAKEGMIQQQQHAIRELSTPVLQLREGLLMLPIVGMVDTQRARHLTEALLRAIRDRRARVAVMDITGVPIVDSKVANHIVQACEAARLMGAGVIITGISAEIAQALVTIGAELRGVRTIGDLQAGIEEAEALLGYRVSTNGNQHFMNGAAPEAKALAAAQHELPRPAARRDGDA
jgi:rsbT co-antagonist protein RsbR